MKLVAHLKSQITRDTQKMNIYMTSRQRMRRMTPKIRIKQSKIKALSRPMVIGHLNDSISQLVKTATTATQFSSLPIHFDHVEHFKEWWYRRWRC